MKSQNVYIGNSSCNGIYHYKLMNGSFVALGNISGIEKCTYLCKKDNIIYGVIEQVEGKIFSYNTDNNEINITETGRACPCHISVSDDTKYLFVSHYRDGYKQIYEIKTDGTIGNLILDEVQDNMKSHTHYMKSYNGKLYCVDIGLGSIEVYSLNDGINFISKVELGEDIEPRHLCFHKDNIFAITEKSCRIYTLKLENNELVVIGYRELLPENIARKDNYTGCAICISNDGKYLYTTIREHNSISVFKNTSGKLKLVQNIDSNGELPWDIKIDKDGRYAIVVNASSDDISLFEINKFNGKLKYIYKSSMNAPSYVLVD